MNSKWDTPPDGDFVRYLEQMTAPAPGAVPRRSAAAAPRAGRPVPAAAPAPTPFGAPSQRPVQRAAVQGPPDLADVLRQLLGQLGSDRKKERPPGR